MTRIQEPDPDLNNEVPDYKSPHSRIIRSLRQAYDNQRSKNKKKSETIQDLREKLRDTQQSRDSWKERIKAIETEIEALRKKNEELENSIKKKSRNDR
jgi:peptidoglycan hydrolase CwlO-like protein